MPPYLQLAINQAIWRQRVLKVGGTTRYVDPVRGNDGSNGLKPHKPMRTIAACIAASESWDNIFLFDGVYAETFIVDVYNMVIHGESMDGTIIRPAAAVDVIEITAPNCTLENLKVEFPTGVGATSAVTFNSYHNTFRNVWLSNTGNDGFGFVMSMGNDKQLIEDCYVDGFLNQMNIVGGEKHIVRRNYLTLNGAGGINIYIDGTTECIVTENDLDGGGAGSGIDSAANVNNSYFHNNIFNHAALGNAAEDSTNNHWWANYYDDGPPDIDHDGYGDSPYDVGNPAGTYYDYRPIPRYNGFLGLEGGGAGGGGGGTFGSTELWESFEYVDDAQLQLNWIPDGVNAGAPTLSATFYPMYGSQYSMQEVIGGGGAGYVYRLIAARNFKQFLNITIAARSSNAGDSFRFTLYDSLGNYSYWTQTITLANTWYDFNINIHTAPTGSSATPVNLEDIVEVRLANLTAGHTYLFDVITFEGIITQDIENINYGDRVYVSDAGVASTDYPYGTPTYPTSSVANGVTIAAIRNLRKIDLRGTLTINTNISQYEFFGSALGLTYITAAAGIINPNCTFNNCIITGALNGPAQFENKCMLINVTGLDGAVRNCDLGGTIQFDIPTFGYVDLNKISTVLGPITLDCTNLGAGDAIRIHEFDGTMTITNATDPDISIRIYSSTGANIIVDVTCTAALIECFGNCNVINTSSAATVLRKSINAIATRTLVYDNFDDNLLGYDWNDAVTGGSTLQSETGGKYKFANAGAGTAGESYLNSAYQFDRNITVEAEIQVVDGEAAGDGERCEGYIELYQDATHWIKFGPYRDTSAGVNARGYIQLQGSTATADGTDLDNENRRYKIVISSDMIYFYIDDVEVYAYQWGIVRGYEAFNIRLGASTQNNADIIDIRFDEFKINNYSQRDEDIWTKLQELDTLDDKIDTILGLSAAELVTTETGGTITTDGTEQNVYINNAPAGVYEPRAVQIDFTNQTAAETVVIRTYYRINPAGNLIQQDEVTFAGVQDPPLKTITLVENRYGIRVTIEKTGGSNLAYDWEVIYRA
jgi:hypothetical protein